MTVKPADVDMPVVGVCLAARVTSGVLLTNVLDGQIVTQRVADGDRANSEPITTERRRYWHVIVQPVDGATERRRTHYDQLPALVDCPHLVHRLRY